MKVYGQKRLSREPEQNHGQSTPVYQSFKVSIEFKAFLGTKKAKGEKTQHKTNQPKPHPPPPTYQGH